MRLIHMNNNTSSLLTTDEVANQLGIKSETLQVWRCTRRYNLPYIKVGGRVRYKAEDIESFIQKRTVHQENLKNNE